MEGYLGLIDKFERGFLFSLTRFVALFFIGIAILGLIISITLSVSSLIPPNTKLSAEELNYIATPPKEEEGVNNNIYVDSSETLNTPDPLANIKLPFSVKKHFSHPEDLSLLKTWLSDMTIEEKNNFIDEMAIVITHAENGKENPNNAINRYKNYKLQKIAEQKQELLNNYYQNGLTLGVLATTIVIIALFSLVLVLLAIERNTRIKNV